MNTDEKRVFDIFVRYLVILIFGLGNLFLFYEIFTPLTVFAFSGILKLFGEVILYDNIIVFGNNAVEIIPACVAGAAYFLLFALNMSNRMDAKKRFESLLFLLGGFFVLNVTRLLVLTSIIDFSSFELIHWISWHLVSTVFVVGLWFLAIKLFKIKTVPVADDVNFFVGLIKPKSKKKSKVKKKNKKSGE